MITNFTLLFALICCGSVVASPLDGHTTSAVSPLMKHVCFENVLHPGEMLFPCDKKIQKSWGIMATISTGAAMTGLPESIPTCYRKWTLEPKDEAEKSFYIHNEEQHGYLNSYGSRDSDRRYVFVGNDRRDVWKFHENPSIEGAFALENVPTGEFLYAILGDIEPGHSLNYFSGQTTRSVYLWNFKELSELHADKSSYWFLRDCSQLCTGQRP